MLAWLGETLVVLGTVTAAAYAAFYTYKFTRIEWLSAAAFMVAGWMILLALREMGFDFSN